MATIDWLGWLLPALKLQLNWVDLQSTVLRPIHPEVTALRLGNHLSRLSAQPPAALALAPATFNAFGPAPALNTALPKAAMLSYEGSTLADVIAAPLLAALTVDTSVAACATVRERIRDTALCSLETGGFDAAVPESEASRQLADLITMAATRTPQDIDLIQGQAASAWPFVVAACGKPVEHRLATRTLLDVGLTVLHPLIAQTKHHLNVERPRHAGLSIAVAMPGHQSAPSGHAAVAYLLAGLLAPLQPTALARERLFAAAASIAANRELAGVHFRSDSQAGQALGLSLASWLTGLAVGREFLHAAFNLSAGALPTYNGFTAVTVTTPEWQWLYQRVRAEWT